MEPPGNKYAPIHLFSSWGATNLEFFCRIFRHENEDVLNQNWHLRLPLGVSAISWEAHSSQWLLNTLKSGSKDSLKLALEEISELIYSLSTILRPKVTLSSFQSRNFKYFWLFFSHLFVHLAKTIQLTSDWQVQMIHGPGCIFDPWHKRHLLSPPLYYSSVLVNFRHQIDRTTEKPDILWNTVSECVCELVD